MVEKIKALRKLKMVKKKFYGVKLGNTEIGIQTDIPNKTIKKIKKKYEDENNRTKERNKKKIA